MQKYYPYTGPDLRLSKTRFLITYKPGQGCLKILCISAEVAKYVSINKIWQNNKRKHKKFSYIGYRLRNFKRSLPWAILQIKYFTSGRSSLILFNSWLTHFIRIFMWIKRTSNPFKINLQNKNLIMC